MAEVANSSSTVSSSSLPLLSEGPDLGMLSPGVKEAMDRIFPNSASQFLTTPKKDNRGSQSHDSVSSMGKNFKESSAISSITSEGGIARVDSPLVPSETSPAVPQLDRNSLKNATNEKVTLNTPRKIGKLRISRTDVEMAATAVSDQQDDRRKNNFQDSNSGSELNSKASSDSEDMCRPFKLKKKKHKKKRKEHFSGQSISMVENMNSEEEFVSPAKMKSSSTVAHKVAMKPLEQEHSSYLNSSEINDSISSNHEAIPAPLSVGDISKTTKSSTDASLSCAASNVSHPDKVHGILPSIDPTPWNDTLRNILSKPIVENEGVPSRAHSGLKLPKPRKKTYHLNNTGDKYSIPKVFPSCHVVLTKLSTVSSPCTKDIWSELEAPLPLEERLILLKKMCASEKIPCRPSEKKRKQKKNPLSDSLNHLFEVNNHSGQSEDEFQTRGGKSLRRRNKNISYTELTEKDLDLDDGSSRRRKRKDSDDYIPESGSEAEKSSKNNSDPNKNSKATGHSASSSDKNWTEAKSADGKTHVIVYPKTTVSSVSTSLPPAIPSFAAGGHPLAFPSASIQGFNQVNRGPLSLANAMGPLPGQPLVSGLFGQPISGAPPMSTFPTASGSTALPTSQVNKPQYCMMKVDGKDVLVQLMPSQMTSLAGSNVPGTQQVILPGGKRFVMSNPSQLPAARSMVPGLSGPRVMGLPSNANIAPNPRASLPPGMVVNTGTRVPILASPQITGALSNSGVRLPVSLATLGQVGAMSATPGAINVRPIVSSATPMLGATTMHSQANPSLSAASSSGQNVARNLRVFVPGCQATGTAGHFTTLLGNLSGGHPLTRLTASSALLPQKRSADKTVLTPEQKAAKRRKLEKKYPLPPGVVIKTEPDPTPTPVAAAKNSTAGMRSLLQQNVQLVGGPRGSMQSIRIVAPSLASTGGNVPVRPGSSVMYRAANVGGRQTVLVPVPVSNTTTIETCAPSIATTTTTACTTSAAPPPPTHNSQSVTASQNARQSITPASNLGDVQAAQAALCSLRSLVQSQEASGLTGARMDKLKALLKQKEDHLKSLQKSDPPNEPTVDSVNGDIEGTENDPFVID